MLSTSSGWIWRQLSLSARAFLLFLPFVITLACPGADTLKWDSKRDRVDADIANWSLTRLLKGVSQATGWKVYVEPDARRRVSAKFSDRPPGEALKLLLGELNYAFTPPGIDVPGKLLVYHTLATKATQLIEGSTNKIGDTSKPIPNQLILTVKPGTDIDALAKKLGAKVIGRAEGLNAYLLEFGDDEAASRARNELGENQDVVAIDSNFNTTRVEPMNSGAAVTAPVFNLKPRPLVDGKSFVVGLIDTPIQSLGPAMDPFILPALSLAGEATPDAEGPTHATGMAQSILQSLNQVAQGDSQVRILPVDVYGNNSATTTFDVAQGIIAAMNAGAGIINLSLGSEGDSRFLYQVIQAGYNEGRLFFAAAGNEPTATPTYPAAYPIVVAVTAGQGKGQIASYANYGSFVDVVAPGTALVRYGNNLYQYTGTSTSTAVMSGIAAGLADKTGQTLRQVENTIRTSSPAPKPGQ